mgnify:CR=1 FL=1
MTEADSSLTVRPSHAVLPIVFEEVKILWPKVNEFVKTYKREPDINSLNPIEKRLAETIIYLKKEKRQLAQDEQG